MRRSVVLASLAVVLAGCNGCSDQPQPKTVDQQLKEMALVLEQFQERNHTLQVERMSRSLERIVDALDRAFPRKGDK